MPVIGLPKVLETMLAAVVKEEELVSWQVFQEKDGRVTFKLKFGGHVAQEQDPLRVHYKKKTEKQCKRDLERATAYRNKGVVTRSKAKEAAGSTSPEAPRDYMSPGYSPGLPCLFADLDQPSHDKPPLEDPGQCLDSSTQLVSPTCPSEDTPQRFDPVLPVTEVPGLSTPPSLLDSAMQNEDNNSCTSDSETSECHSDCCMYGDGSIKDHSKTYYLCNLCSSSWEDAVLCLDCHSRGVHGRHHHALTFVND